MNVYQFLQQKWISVRELRLMTKFDYRSQLPKLFIDHHITYIQRYVWNRKI